MTEYIESLKTLIYNGKAIKGIESRGFGGFCKCDGIMVQKTWHESDSLQILVAECENCWRTEILVFSGSKLVDRREVRVITRNEIRGFLSERLSVSELEAILDKAKGDDYNYGSFSRAKKKLESIGLDVNEIINELILI